MARQRIFNPNFWKSKNIKKLIRECGCDAALFYWGLVSLADDEGRGTTDIDALSMDMPIMNLSDELVLNWLSQIKSLGLIYVYDGFYVVPDWFEKQNIPKPYPSETPLPPINFYETNIDYFNKLLSQLNNISQRLTKENKIIPCKLKNDILTINNQYTTSIKPVTNHSDHVVKGKEVKGKEVKGKEVKGKEVKGKEKSESEFSPIFIPLKDGFYEITEQAYKTYKNSYPNLNIQNELSEIRKWNIDPKNKDRRKDKTSIDAHIWGWFKRSHQNYKDINGDPEHKLSVDQEKDQQITELESEINTYPFYDIESAYKNEKVLTAGNPVNALKIVLEILRGKSP